MAVNTRTPRQAAKRRTREQLLGAALRLHEFKGFGSISLREVTRDAGVVPTAFYRHFQDMEELGLALVDESFRALRAMLREARAGAATESAIRGSVAILVDHIHQNRRHFRFIMRERFGGVSALRHAIRADIRLFSSELATDLSRFPYLDRWSTEDLQMMAGLMVNAMVSIAEEVLELPEGSTELEDEIIRTAERQLRLIALGVPQWKGAAGSPAAP